jgi:hypothetical protein
MNNFLKIVVVFGALSAFQNSFSQEFKKGFRLGFALNGGIPMNNNFDFSLGADARLQYNITPKTSVAGTTGYTHFFDGGAPDSGFIPLKVGFKRFLDNQFYALGEMGAGVGVTSGMGTTFIWAPGIGVATKNIDVSLRYENYNHFDTSQVSLRVAYGFPKKFKKR